MHSLLDDIALTHFVVTCALVGLIWTVQIVVYPQFSRVPEAAFVEYHTAHMRAITLVVGPLILVEALTAGPLVWHGWGSVGFHLSLLLLGVVWLSTWVLQVPAHARLASGFDQASFSRLLRTNWIRTTGWTLRAALLSYEVLISA